MNPITSPQKTPPNSHPKHSAKQQRKKEKCMIHNYKISDNVESKRESLRCLDYVDTLGFVSDT